MTTGNPKPEMVPVKSSQISRIGYDEATQTLAVEFKSGSGSLYHYSGVPASAHEALMAADSKGTHLGKHIKGTHPHKKIVQEAPHGGPMF